MRKPKTEKAMLLAVAKDVLKLLAEYKLGVQCGRYLDASLPDELDDIAYSDWDKVALQKAVPKIARFCTVCAKGAMVLAHLHLFDGIKILPGNYGTGDRATELFGTQGHLIEAAFECSNVSTELDNDDPSVSAAIRFGSQYSNNRRRMRAIMQNIVRNNGVFKP